MNYYTPSAAPVRLNCASCPMSQCLISQDDITYVFPPSPIATFATPSPPSASPRCSSRLGEQLVSSNDVLSTSASRSLVSKARCLSMNARICSSVETLKTISKTIQDSTKLQSMRDGGRARVRAGDASWMLSPRTPLGYLRGVDQLQLAQLLRLDSQSDHSHRI